MSKHRKEREIVKKKQLYHQLYFNHSMQINSFKNDQTSPENSRRGRYQEVGGRRDGDPVVEQFSCVVVHGPTLFHRL